MKPLKFPNAADITEISNSAILNLMKDDEIEPLERNMGHVPGKRQASSIVIIEVL